MSDRVEEYREQIANRLGEPNQLRFPSDLAMTSSWRRAQAAPSHVGAVNPTEFDVLLGREDDENALSKHRVLFAVYEGDLVAVQRALRPVVWSERVPRRSHRPRRALGIVARQTRLFDEGTASDAVADSAASVGERAGELLGRALSNQLVLAALTLGGVWLLTSGAFTPTERLIISIGTVPVAMFLIPAVRPVRHSRLGRGDGAGRGARHAGNRAGGVHDDRGGGGDRDRRWRVDSRVASAVGVACGGVDAGDGEQTPYLDTGR